MDFLQLDNDAFQFLLVFCRLGAAAMVMPTIGEAYVKTTIRLSFAVLFSILMYPILRADLPALPSELNVMGLLILKEIIVGIFLATLLRLSLIILTMAGSLISFLTALSAAQAFNPMLEGQGTLHAAFFSLLGVTLIFVLDLHHPMLTGLMNSYILFPPANFPLAEDMSKTVLDIFSTSFNKGLQAVMPFVFLGLMFYVVLGLMARLIPQVQIIFVSMPAQIIGGFFLTVLALTAVVGVFVTYYKELLFNYN